MKKNIALFFFVFSFCGASLYFIKKNSQQEKAVLQKATSKKSIRKPINETKEELAIEVIDKQFLTINRAWQEKLKLVFQEQWKFSQKRWQQYLALREEYLEKKMDLYEEMADHLEASGRLYDGPIEDFLQQDENYLKFEKAFGGRLTKVIGAENIAEYKIRRNDFNLDWEQKTPGEGPILLIEF